MTKETLKFWSLVENPFRNDISNKKYFYRSGKYDEAIKRIVGGVREQNTDITMIYGEVGTGKSFTSAIILEELKKLGYVVVYYPTTYGNMETLLCKIARDVLDNERPTTITEATLVFESYLEQLMVEDTQLVIILDEAHEYDDEMLGNIRQLSNYNSQSPKKLVSLIIVGQTELIVKLRSIKQLNSRIKERQYLEYMTKEEIGPYVTFKMTTAGYNKRRPSLFKEHEKMLQDATYGMPRMINNICEAALEIAARKNEPVLTDATMQQAINERGQMDLADDKQEALNDEQE